jgi:hypothetical protein
MKKFEIESEIEKTPTMFGLRALYGFFFAFISLMTVPIVGMNLSFDLFGLVLLIAAIIVLGGIYLALYYLSQTFQANRMGDEKMPDTISSNP